jgi:hypothetical protein
MNLEIFGSYMKPEGYFFHKPPFDTLVYEVYAKCEDNCHKAKVFVADDAMPWAFPYVEKALVQAFKAKHG